MQDALILTGIATLTVLATGLGAIPVMLLGARAEALRPVLSGVAMGVMGVAAVVGLLIPAVKEGTPAQVVGGIVLGAGGLFWAGRALRRRLGDTSTGKADRAAWLTFGVLFVHSLPEAGHQHRRLRLMGTPWSSPSPCRTSPRHRHGDRAARPAGPGCASSRPPSSAACPRSERVVAWAAVDAVNGLLPVSFAAAGAAMFLLVTTELAPEAWRDGGRGWALTGTLAGAAGMLLLAVVLAPDAGR